MNVEGKDKKNGKKTKEDEKSSSSSDSDLSSDAETTWIIWFCSLKGNEFFTEIDVEYIEDDFNLTGLSNMVPHFDQALDVILDGDTDDSMTDDQQDEIETAAEMLYGLIHARYILTNRGLAAMVEKYNTVQFGRCPRVFCQGQPVLPVGQSDIPRMNTAKLFCPRCQDIYYPKLSRHANLDGAYFGTTFPHLLMQMYPELIPTKPLSSYIPRIYGFKIHKSARQLQQQQQQQQQRQAALLQQQLQYQQRLLWEQKYSSLLQAPSRSLMSRSATSDGLASPFTATADSYAMLGGSAALANPAHQLTRSNTLFSMRNNHI